LNGPALRRARKCFEASNAGLSAPIVSVAGSGTRCGDNGNLLAPGHFLDHLAESGADWVTAPLGAHPAITALVIDRY
jgi:hypothetical protein